jgi:glycosyltransferase involved in cell wall biosynthesis
MSASVISGAQVVTESPRQPKVLIAAGRGHITEVEMIKGLRREGIDIHAAFEGTSPHLEALRDGGVPTRTLDLKSNADFRGALKIRRWIKHECFDIVHGLANRQVANFIWASYGLSNKVIAYRGAIGHVSRWDPTCYIKWLNPRIDKIICVSKAVERDLAASGVKSHKLVTIYKGHDLAWYAHLDRKAARADVDKEFGIPSDAILVGMAANMRRVKGADLLLRALMELHHSVHGLFIGEVRDPEITRLAGDPRIAERVHFTGFRSDAPYLIGALDINVAPSRGREGLTKTIIEGMVQNVPAVVSTAGGLPELITNNLDGLIFPIDEQQELTKCLRDIASNKEKRESMGNNSAASIEAKFQITNTILKTALCYRALSRPF